MTISTFFPDADPESDSVDGGASRIDMNTPWAGIHDGVGTSSNSNSSEWSTGYLTGTTNTWVSIRRFIVLFDTASLSTDTISSAVVEFTANFKDDDFTDTLALVASTPNGTSSIIDTDYIDLGTTRFDTDMAIAGITTDSSTFNTFTLNAAGLAAIDDAGVSKFGILGGNDLDDTEPGWVDRKQTRVDINTADLSESQGPRLVVTQADAGFAHSQAAIF